MTDVDPEAVDFSLHDLKSAVTASVTAKDVVRGVGRYFAAQGNAILTEVPLPNGRRADISVVNGRGEIIIVEIKVSRSDLLGDRKWTDYLDFCDQFFWAIPPELSDEPLYTADYLPARSGILRADRYGAAIVRSPSTVRLSAPRRKAEILRFSRLAAGRLLQVNDPQCGHKISDSAWL